MVNAAKNTIIRVKVAVEAPLPKVWQYFTDPSYIIGWNFASDDWFTPKASNELFVGGRFNYLMSAKDHSISFNFSGTYTLIDQHRQIAYTLDDGRAVTVRFIENGKTTEIVETFEAEESNPVSLQQIGWQNILDNFKNYTETN